MVENLRLPEIASCRVASCSRISAVHRDGDFKVGCNGRLCDEFWLASSDEPMCGIELGVWQLTRPMRSNEITDAFGGGEEIEIALNHVWQVMTANSRGLLPISLADGQMNLSFARNLEGELRLVFNTRWHCQLPEWFAYRNWDLGALDASGTEARPWPAGTRVIGRPALTNPANNP